MDFFLYVEVLFCSGVGRSVGSGRASFARYNMGILLRTHEVKYTYYEVKLTYYEVKLKCEVRKRPDQHERSGNRGKDQHERSNDTWKQKWPRPNQPNQLERCNRKRPERPARAQKKEKARA